VARIPDVAVPLASYSVYGFAGPDLCDAFGQAIALPATRAAREATGDPRLSLEERYPAHDAYVAKVRTAAEALQRDGFMLQEDIDRFVQAAQASSVGN
jgi:hypothetical protein